MKARYDDLAARIKACSSCYFRNLAIQPLPAAEVDPPVPVMFIGENPSWEEGQRIPFDESTTSGQSLDANYLQPLRLSRNEVWITDLFKCRYPKSVLNSKQREEPKIQREVVEACKQWLTVEISFARPSILVTLSERQDYASEDDVFSSYPGPICQSCGQTAPS